MRRFHDLFLCSLLALLVACSPADLIKPMLGGDSGPEVTAQIGKENESNKVKVENTSTEVNEVQGNQTNITSTPPTPWYVWLLAFGGWFVASPFSLYDKWKARKNKE